MGKGEDRLGKTPKELMDDGVWELLGTKKVEKGVLHYYAEKRENGEFWVSYMTGIQTKWIPPFYVLTVLCRGLRWVANRISKGMGNDMVDELLEEVDEVMKARNHKLTIGHAFTRPTKCTTIEECKDYMERDFARKNKGEKKK